MAIKNKSNRKPEIDLTGPQGNAFFLLGTAAKYAKDLELDSKKIQDEMKNGDYQNLIEVFDKYFGEYVDLVK
jgi:hypothetical protein